MSRTLVVAAAQVGAVHMDTPRQEVLERLLALLEQAHEKGVQVLVYPSVFQVDQCDMTLMSARQHSQPSSLDGKGSMKTRPSWTSGSSMETSSPTQTLP